MMGIEVDHEAQTGFRVDVLSRKEKIGAWTSTVVQGN